MTLSSDAPRVAHSSPSTLTVQESPLYLPASDRLISPQVSLANYTSWRVGGMAQWYVTPKTVEEVQESLSWAAAQALPVTFMGAGSNLLISTLGIPGLVVNTSELRYCTFEPSTGQITAGAGEPIARLAWQAARRGWRGLEWAVGIPGTVGGAVVMNAGAHHQCIADLLVEAVVMSADGELSIVTAEALDYDYRTSNLQGDSRFVVEATFQLQPGATRAEVMKTTKTYRQQRTQTQPYHLPSCGSVFRNSTQGGAGWLIEQTGLKGYQIGQAQVSTRHANFIVNLGNAKAEEIFQLICHVQHAVYDRWSVILMPEVKMIGDFSSMGIGPICQRDHKMD